MTERRTWWPGGNGDRAGDAASGPMVRFVSVCKTYPNGVEAVRDVSFDVAAGELVFIVGPTGVGKSTLLKLIYREELPTRGTVHVDGRDVTRLPAREIPYLRRRVGVVFQDFRLLPRKSVWENVAFALEVTGSAPPHAGRQVTDLLDVVGLGGRLDALPRELSAGEQQRVSIARALVHRPRLLLADEPTGNLDPDTAWEIMQLLQRINGDGTTVLVTTHDQVVVDRARRRVIAIDRGTMVRDEAEGMYAGGA